MNLYKYVCIWLHIQKHTRYLDISRQFSLAYGKFLPLHIMQLNFNMMFLGFLAGIIFLETFLLSLFLFLNWFLWSSSTIWKSVKKTEQINLMVLSRIYDRNYCRRISRKPATLNIMDCEKEIRGMMAGVTNDQMPV